MTDEPEFQQACPGPPSAGPVLTEGPSGLVSGLYLAGGPPVRRTRREEGVPSAGTIAVTDVMTGETVATVTVARGQLATIPLAPGSYRIDGTCTDALSNGVPRRTRGSVTVPPGMTVRQDLAIHIR